ncbi:bifunctional DNA-formamidopyrimidine glycosylase/DNA-(apurinic or apyrimidinic site) lyase [Chitinivorax sp. PXF-14]|uniref:bifunctional DNA-formamidopyrimidine glycosylase/DNA-(apurinic or apyrimidinic site) lyase n=1 Tax=Chitinivorax sp. PXF-14 TaxID=3230488 RepID=UPI0034669146
MPELPEVETTRRGIEPSLLGQTITGAVVRNAALRWPVPDDLNQQLAGASVAEVARRGKYLLIDCGRGWIMIHLGMSGSLRLVRSGTPPDKHDHVDIVLTSGWTLRLRDPRRFGAVLWVPGHIANHPLLRELGPEPLSPSFNADYLYEATRGRSAAIKLVIMDSHTVVGVGNIYASESLFRAGIRPTTPAQRLGHARCAKLVEAIQATLDDAIRAGGSTLRDFVDSAGNSGYFQLQTFVYDRAGQACRVCGGEIRLLKQGQRSTYYCVHCQH